MIYIALSGLENIVLLISQGVALGFNILPFQGFLKSVNF